jgi:hypothetical protein
MFLREAEEEIKKIYFLDDAMSRRVSDKLFNTNNN